MKREIGLGRAGEAQPPRPLRARYFGYLLAVLVCMGLTFGTSESYAAFGASEFDGEVARSDGSPETQAGAHPFAASAVIGFNAVTKPVFGSPIQVPDGSVRDIEVDLPAGFIGNPTATPRCLEKVFSSDNSGCPDTTQVGYAVVTLGGVFAGLEQPAAVYNLVPPVGLAAQFGFIVQDTQVRLFARVRTDGDGGVTLNVADTPQTLPVLKSELTFWGNPADPVHDSQRGVCALFGGSCPSQGDDSALLTNPTSCTGPVETKLRMRSWRGETDNASFFTHMPPPDQDTLIGTDRCEDVPFEPEFSATPTTGSAESPTGLNVSIEMPTEGLESPTGIAQAHLKKAVVTLPEGMTVNPASARGLSGCSAAQIGLKGRDFPEPNPIRFSATPDSCPNESKIGTVEIETPLLDDPLKGSVFLAEQGNKLHGPQANPFDSMLALYISVEDPRHGIFLKLPGKVSPDPQTGRLRAVFDHNPQLPFRTLRVHFKSGARAPLVTPPTCGTHTTLATFSPWSAADPNSPTADEMVTSTSSFEITSGPNGAPCLASVEARGFSPELTAGTASPTAGTYSPFVLRLTKPDGQQDLKGLSVMLPEGLTGKLQGVPYCPEGALAPLTSVTNTTPGTATDELASPSCPASSLVGRVTIGAGAGPSPFYVQTGRVYLAGPYKGAPLSLAIVTPALAGPFDLGNVLVRSAIRVDERTARLTVVSDEVPTILEGIPLKIRDLRVNVDRDEFTLNPTDCREQEITAHVTATYGKSADLSERFQVGDCAALGFKPRFRAKILNEGRRSTRRSFNPRMRFTVRGRDGEANIGRAAVTLPPQVILDQSHIRTTCTRQQFADRACPEGSIYGHAKAWSPVLKRPLEGPVYLASNGGARELPDLVADLDGEVRIVLEGWIDTAKGGRIRNIFPAVPDAPVSRFALTMRGGKRGLLVNSKDLCHDKRRGVANFRGQNGARSVTRPRIGLSYKGCAKVRKKAARKARRLAARRAVRGAERS